MGKSVIRLLLNAEPFGFGPTAAVAAIFPHIKGEIEEISYIGSGHTLDLQRSLPYKKLYDQNQLDEAGLQEVLQQHDVLLTASDFGLAQAARKAGLKLGIYDPLAWYWKEFPAIAREADLYIAQDFYGVAERVRAEFNNQANWRIVPPIVNTVAAEAHRQHGILLNLGGLQNPHWPLGEAVDYARTMIAAVRRVLPANETLTIATSQAIAAQLSDPQVKTCSVEEMRHLRHTCRIALMTPGLGNIFDAAAEQVATIWLPPANDSQGQQADILLKHQPDTSRIDWKDINPGWEINYRDSQPEVLRKIEIGRASCRERV